MSIPSKIPFNRPFIAGKELFYIAQAVTNGQIAADGEFTKRCHRFMEERFGIRKVLLTSSGTAALEIAAQLANLGPGDEAIMPSFTFVSTANAVVKLGAKPVFVDVRSETMNLDERLVEQAVTSRTRAIIPVHYGGVSVDMDPIMAIAKDRGLIVIEDAAQGVSASYKNKPLGSIGHLAAFSFHETKNFICGEGGALAINDPTLIERAEIIRDKGTNRQKFIRGQVDKYTWVDVGSSYVPSEINSAFLWAQFEHMEEISLRRAEIYERYATGLIDLEREGKLRLPHIPSDCQSNHHLFHLLLNSEKARNKLMDDLREDGILSVFHYVPLHTSPMGLKLGFLPGTLAVTEDLSTRLLRLPFYFELTQSDQQFVIERIHHHLKG